METERDKWLVEYCGYLRAEAAMVDAEDGLDSCTTRACLLRGAADEIERLHNHCKEDAHLYVKAMNTIADLETQLAEARAAAYAGWVAATGYPIAEWVYEYHPFLRVYKPEPKERGLPILGTISDEGAVLWSSGD
jgi:hypothetical protein